MTTKSSMYIDGGLYYGIAACGALQTGLAMDSVKAAICTLIPEPFYHIILLINGSFFVSGLTALKTFRSTAFADHKAENGNGKEVK